VDIGGGNGSLIASVLQRYPKLNGLLFELAMSPQEHAKP
jgi:O-methyltransferase domain